MQSHLGFCDSRDWIENLAINPSTIYDFCLSEIQNNRITDGHSFANKIAKRLETEKVAFDIGAYRMLHRS